MPRIDPAAPPTRDSVLDSDGNPIIGSDMPKYFIWLDVVEKKLKTANPDYFELYTTGVHTTSKHTVVTNAEHATELYDNADRPKYTFAVPSPLKAQSSAVMSEEITKSGRFSVNPDLISKIDRSGANTIDAWLENSTMRDALSAACDGVGRKLLLLLQTKKKEYQSDPDVNTILQNHAAWYFRTGIPAPTADAFDTWVAAAKLWNEAQSAVTVTPERGPCESVRVPQAMK